MGIVRANIETVEDIYQLVWISAGVTSWEQQASRRNLRRLRQTEVIQHADIRNAAAPNVSVPKSPTWWGRRGSPTIGQFLLVACCSQEVAGYQFQRFIPNCSSKVEVE